MKMLNQERYFTKSQERFWRLVDKRSENECWPWIGSSSRHNPSANYGRFIFRGGKWYASRFVALLKYGELTWEQCALHSCDNPICVNPAHIFLGTRGDNNRDCNAKGRRNQVRGMRVGISRLTNEMVMELRRLAQRRNRGFISRMARHYGVSRTAIRYAITNGWKHVAP